jgi:hypothetical protein
MSAAGAELRSIYTTGCEGKGSDAAAYARLAGSGYPADMAFSLLELLENPERYPPRLRAELIGYLRCPEDVRAAVRERLRQDPSFTGWCDLLDELEARGDRVRQAIRDSLEASARRRSSEATPMSGPESPIA